MDFDDLDEAEEAAEAAAAAAEEAAGQQGKQTELVLDDGKEVPYADFLDQYVADWMAQKFTFKAPGPPQLNDAAIDADFEARRLVATQNRETLQQVGCKPLPPFVKLTKPQVEKLSRETLNGEMYGLKVPPTLKDLEEYGAKWLTEAFHAAGTLPRDNSVAKVVKFKRLPMTGQMAAGGSGPKAFITVEYAKPDPDLHTELFAKLPWACDGETKEMGCDPFYRWKVSCNLDYEAQETTIYRFLGPIFPFKIPKYYFADICRPNTNYVLITEKVPFGSKDQKEWKPYEIMPVAEKYFDFQLPPTMRYEMYYSLMRSQARMAAWDKMGFFDMVPGEMRGMSMCPPLLGQFEWPLKLPKKRRDTLLQQAETLVKLWEEFLSPDYGGKIYPKEYSDRKFVLAIKNCARAVQGYSQDLMLYGGLFPDMVGLQHANLQSDNAYYWRKEDGNMDAGLIDWGGAAPRNYAQVASGCLTSAEGEILDEHEDGFIRCFIGEYYKECGIKLDFYEFRRQWHLAYCNYVAGMGTNVEMEIFRETPREQWKDVKSMWDPKVVGRWNVRCYVFMIEHALKYLHIRWKRSGEQRLPIHEVFIEWQEYWESKGMQ